MKLRGVHWFLICALLWIWAFWVPFALGEAGLIPQRFPMLLLPLGGFGLLLVTALFAWREGGLGSVKRWLALTGRAGQAPRVWLWSLAPALLLLLVMAGYALAASPPEGGLAIPFSAGLLGVLVLAWIEETVWRGFALPRLLAVHGPLAASAVLAGAWLVFHFPLYWIPSYNAWGLAGYLAWVPWYVVYTFFLTELALRSRNSVLVATVSHFAVNWVIAWYEPAWMENVGALGGSGLLVLAVVFLARHRAAVVERADVVEA